jgi:hypothetical protein
MWRGTPAGANSTPRLLAPVSSLAPNQHRSVPTAAMEKEK